MAAGVPVISTTLGAEGLDVSNGADIVIADTNEQLIEAVTSVVEDDELRRRISNAGRELVSRRYEWTIAGESLFKIYEALITERTL
jgi:glycosyltransferase involved in cell wall biosynthesis